MKTSLSDLFNFDDHAYKVADSLLREWAAADRRELARLGYPPSPIARMQPRTQKLVRDPMCMRIADPETLEAVGRAVDLLPRRLKLFVHAQFTVEGSARRKAAFCGVSRNAYAQGVRQAVWAVAAVIGLGQGD